MSCAHHVLLIGIDAYPAKPLYGAVQDIDAIQRALLAAGIEPACILRLASPHADHDRASRPATYAAILDALDLIAARVAPDDRVLIYYAGHGTSIEIGGARHRALVPIDGFTAPDDPRLVFESVLHARLAAIAARTPRVTVVLDASHTGGAEPTARCLDCPDAWPPLELATLGSPGARGLAPCAIAAATAEHEPAYEHDIDGAWRGAFSRALLDALAATSLLDATWRQIWQRVRAELEDRGQHAWLAVDPGGAVLGDAPRGGTPGMSVIRTGSTYRLDAGTLAGVTSDALVAVYGDQPALLPRLHSRSDREARLGTLRVTLAGRADSIAISDDGAAAVEADLDLVPYPAPHTRSVHRARVIAVGAPERLRCAIDHATLAATLRASPLLEVVDRRETLHASQARLRLAIDEPGFAGRGSAPRAQVWLARDAARWILRDAAGPLLALADDELRHLRAVLEHYHAYARPLRLAERAGALPGGLALQLAARAIGAGRYAIAEDQPVVLRVHNACAARLRITVACLRAQGDVVVAEDQVVDAHTSCVFAPASKTMTNLTGARPDRPSPQRNPLPVQVERWIAIGRTALASDLGYLALAHTFADVVRGIAEPARRAQPPLDQSTAAQLILERTRVDCRPQGRPHLPHDRW